MNYFQLFEIPVQLKLDAEAISKKYLELSTQLETDILSVDNKEDRVRLLSKTATLSEAWRIFRSPMETIRYVLEIKGLLKEEDEFAFTPNFLLEVMEINEQLLNLEPENDPEEIRDIRESLKDLQANNYDEVKHIIENYREGVSPDRDLANVADYYFQKKYLDRIQSQLDGIM